MLLFLLIITTSELATVLANSAKCSIDAPPLPPKYHKMEKCYRSKLGMVAKANYTSLNSCQRLGIEKKGLAINFSPPEARDEINEPIEYTCEVLKCAESDGGLSLVNDTRYDYYSIYAKPIPNVNSTCVPALGMFYVVSKKLNYTLGFRECKNISGMPADVTSEQRTDALAQLLAAASLDAAFVGMRRMNGSSFISVTGDPLNCTTYRAWAPGHPRRQKKKSDCVLLTRQRMWMTAPCRMNFPMLCELMPGGPYKRNSIFASRQRKDEESEMKNKNDEE